MSNNLLIDIYGQFEVYGMTGGSQKSVKYDGLSLLLSLSNLLGPWGNVKRTL